MTGLLPGDDGPVSWGGIQTILRALGAARPDPLRDLQCRMAALQLARLAAEGAVPYAVVPWDKVVDGERADWVVVGARGTGKTAFAVSLAQAYKGSGREVFGVDWREPMCSAVGLRPLNGFKRVQELREAVVVLDEAMLRVKRTRDVDLYELLALARHRDVVVVLTAQSLYGVQRDILRMDCVIACKWLDPVAAKFEREELLPLLSGLIPIQERLGFRERRSATALYVGGQWAVTENPLPAGWDEKVSRVWR